MFASNISYSAALMAGLLSFLSPCILPLIPAYFSFITGYSLEELTAGDQAGIRRRVVFSTLAYVLGFSVVFICLGASASFLGQAVQAWAGMIRIVGGLLITVFGLHLLGLFRIGFLEFEKKIEVNDKPLHFLGTFLVGMAFGAGWTPCVGPLLGSILILAGAQETMGQGIGLLACYSLGLALPFLVISLFISYLLVFFRKLKGITRYINIISGSLLVLMGVLLMANRLVF